VLHNIQATGEAQLQTLLVRKYHAALPQGLQTDCFAQRADTRLRSSPTRHSGTKYAFSDVVHTFEIDVTKTH